MSPALDRLKLCPDRVRATDFKIDPSKGLRLSSSLFVASITQRLSSKSKTAPRICLPTKGVLNAFAVAVLGLMAMSVELVELSAKPKSPYFSEAASPSPSIAEPLRVKVPRSLKFEPFTLNEKSLVGA